MYEKIKNLAKKWIPKSIIKKNESLLRNIVALKYRGNNHQCNICQCKLSNFIVLSNGEKLCPKCGSLPRTRRLWNLLNTEFDLKEKKLLHFSPPKSLEKAIQKSRIKKYITSDFMGEFEATKNLDITNIDEANHTYDLIICYHVLEHIDEDQKAMSELFRILKSNGTCIIQTPFKDGEIYENSEITSPQDRLAHFGQDDHVRIYSVDGLQKRLAKSAFKINIKSFSNENRDAKSNFWGFKIDETIILARK